MWVNKWVGLPYRELGRGPQEFDCLGLFLALQRERHGRDLFDPLCSMTQAARARLADQVRPEWHRVKIASEGSALLFKVKGMELHVGYALNNRLMLHTSNATGASEVSNFRAAGWGGRLEGIYDYG